MSAQYVTLVLDVRDFSGRVARAGSAVIVASKAVTDPGDGAYFAAPVTADFSSPSSPPSVLLVSTDSAGSGWSYTITFYGVPGNPAPATFSLLASGGSVQYLSQVA